MSEEIKLPEKFKVDGFMRELVERTGDLAIYRVIGSTGKVICYDAVRVVHKKDTLVFGKVIQAREVYPSPSDWGKIGWSCVTLERAKERLREFTEARTLRSQASGGDKVPGGSK